MVIPDDPVQLHTAGATVRHHGPFADLVVPSPGAPLSQDFVERWVWPFYMSFPGATEFDATFERVHAAVDHCLIVTLLSEGNWRPRIVGAFFAAIKNVGEAEPLIGTLLLRSDVCYAADGYCLALARFNSEGARGCLAAYLDYYLARRDLWFDQGVAMGAVAYLDRANGTNELGRFMPQWQQFVEDKPNWDLHGYIAGFSANMDRVLALAERCR